MTVANQFNTEGMEAVRSIKNQSWTNFISKADAGNTGVTNSSGTWIFNGASNIFASDTRFIRTINITSVQRDGRGNIVTSGGTNDPDTRKVSVTTNWDFTNVRPETVDFTEYFSNWGSEIPAGLLVYGRAGNTIPRVNYYTNSDNTFGANRDSIGGAVGRNFVVKTSPTKHEAIVGYVDSNSLRIMCFNGNSWSLDWSSNVGGTGATRRFDIAYEHQSGDVMVLYSTNTANNNELAYRIKAGSAGCGSANWSSETQFSSPATTGVVTWVKLREDTRSGSNVLAAIWADMNRDLQAAIWNGSAWTQRTSALETTLECVGTCSSPNIPNVDSFDIDFESLSGDIMVVWGSGGSQNTNGAWFNKCDGVAPPSCNWNASRTAITGMANDATSLDISANPDTDEILFASIGDGGSDLQAASWSGTAWSGTNDLDTSALTPVAGSSLVATGWLINGSITRGVVVFANSGNQSQRIHGFVWNGSSFVRQGAYNTPWFTPSPLFGAPRWYDIQTDPLNKDKLMFFTSNSINDLYAKRLEMSAAGTFTWTNPTYNDGTVIEAGLIQSISSPYYFSYWRKP